MFGFHSYKTPINTITSKEWLSEERCRWCLQTAQQYADVDSCVTARTGVWCLVSSYTSQDRTLLASLTYNWEEETDAWDISISTLTPGQL